MLTDLDWHHGPDWSLIKSRKKVAEGGPDNGAGMATAGLITGYIGSALSVVIGIIMIVAVVLTIMEAMPQGTGL